jgi:hypothetical protein
MKYEYDERSLKVVKWCSAVDLTCRYQLRGISPTITLINVANDYHSYENIERLLNIAGIFASRSLVNYLRNNMETL